MLRRNPVISKRQLVERYTWHVAVAIASFVFVILVVKFFLFDVGRVDGQSMEPAFVDDNIFFINRWIYLIQPPARYDVVQVVAPGSNTVLLKRIIGLPGDEIIIKRGKVFLKTIDSGALIEFSESYLPAGVVTRVLGQNQPTIFSIGSHQYFVLGDNRSESSDSRIWGPVERSRILGKVIGKW